MEARKILILKLTPSEGNHLKNIHTGEVYAGEIYPAKSLTEADFVEVDEAEYQEYLKIFDEEQEI